MRKSGILILVLALGLLCLTLDALADWSPAKRLTWTSGNSYNPALTADSAGNIHVVWSDDTPGNLEVYYKNSTDAGATWGTAKRLTWNSGASGGQVIAADSSNAIHVVWLDSTPGDFEVYYKKSTDGGTTWSFAHRLTQTSTMHQDLAMAISSDDAIHIAWSEETSISDIFYMRSTDGGASWSAAKQLSWTPAGSYSPTIAVDTDNAIYVAWEDYAPLNWEIYYKRSTDGGTTWGGAKRLTWNSGSSYEPAIALDSSHAIHFIWHDDTPGNYEVYYKRSTDGGAAWSTAKKLTVTPDISEQPTVSIDSADIIHVVWDEWAMAEVYYKKSTDGGATWSGTTRLTWTSGRSQYQAMAIDSSDIVHIVWQDDTPFNPEIYYKKGN